MKKYITTLSIAGSDPSGGAGIQADLKTFSSFQCFGMTVITALTAQNTQGVQAIQTITPQFITKQLVSLEQDIQIDAIKIGMLPDKKAIQAVSNWVKRLNIPIVLDPVMCASSGDILMSQNAIHTLITELIPQASLITPNHFEAQILSQQVITDQNDMIKSVKSMAKLGARNILITGGDLATTRCHDLLFQSSLNTLQWFSGPRIQTKNTHGTGCTLSAAICCCLAKNNDLVLAIKKAKYYITNALEKGADHQFGLGCGPINHFSSGEKNETNIGLTH